MADYYVAPQSGSNSNSGTNLLSPVADWNAAAIGSGTFAPGDRVFFKSDEWYNAAVKGRIAPVFSSSPTEAAPVLFSTYGDPLRRFVVDGMGTRDIGFRPAVSIDQTNGPRWVTVENLEVRRFTSHGISIAETLDTGVTDAYNTVRNCYVHDLTGVSNPAINIYGQGVRVERCIVDNVAADGILIRGRGYCGYNVVTRVSNSGGGLGDSIQFDGNFSNSIIEHNYVDKHTADKQGILVVGSSCQIRYNTVRSTVHVDGAGLLTIFGGSNNFIYGNEVDGFDGIYVLDATGVSYVYGNVIIGRNRNATRQQACGIDVGETWTHAHQISNNFVRGFHTGIFARNTVLRNNLVTDCQIGIDLSVGTSSDSYNYAWGCGDNFAGTPGANSSEADQSAYVGPRGQLIVPEGVTGAGLAAANPLAVAGTYIRGICMINGRPRPGFTPVGAYLATATA